MRVSKEVSKETRVKIQVTYNWAWIAEIIADRIY